MNGEPDPRRALDPVIAGLADGASSGYHAVDRVVQSLRDGLRTQGPGPPTDRFGNPRQAPRAGARTGRPASGRAQDQWVPGTSGQRGADPGRHDHHRHHHHGDRGGQATYSQWYDAWYQGLLGDLTDVLGDALGVIAEAGSGIVGVLEPWLGRDGTPDASLPEVVLGAARGERAHAHFYVWNTGSVRLRDVKLHATDLTGAQGHVERSHVSFLPDCIPRLEIGACERIEIGVKVPRHAHRGTYHGIAQATLAGTWAVLRLEVSA